jgi:hypothetical protein
LLGLIVLVVVIPLGWRWSFYVYQGRIMAALESQGAYVSEDRTVSAAETAVRFLREPRYVTVRVIPEYAKALDVGLVFKLPGLFRLDLEKTTLTAQDAEAISDVPLLQMLCVDRMKVPESLWPSLASLKKLDDLLLEDVAVSDRGFAAISKVHSLKRLHLVNCGVTDGRLTCLCRLPELRDLRVSHSQLSADALRHLKNLPELRSLDLSHCRLTSEALGALKDLPKLESLNLSHCALSNEAVGRLIPLPSASLWSLDLSDNPITDRALKILARTRILGFDLNRTKITDAGMLALARPLSLGRMVSVQGTAITEGGVAKALAVNPRMHVEGVCQSRSKSTSPPKDEKGVTGEKERR